jgi:hypothetical protein
MDVANAAGQSVYQGQAQVTIMPGLLILTPAPVPGQKEDLLGAARLNGLGMFITCQG